MESEELKNIVVEALDDLKGNDIQVLSVGDISSIADFMIIVSGTSNRHVKSLAENVELEVKKQGVRPIGVEGADSAEWILVDLGGVIAHIMLPATRAFYDLESLWTLKPDVVRDKEQSETETQSAEHVRSDLSNT